MEEEFFAVTGPPLYPVPLVGSPECDVDFPSQVKEQEEATTVLKRLYGWISKRSYLDWGLTSSAGQITQQRTCRILQNEMKKTSATYGRVLEGYFFTPPEHSELLKVTPSTTTTQSHSRTVAQSATPCIHHLFMKPIAAKFLAMSSC